jgi:predicted GIY-YIG superfamily endonuclease
MSYFVYILESNRPRHYIGFTSNLEERLIKHNSKHKGFTPWNNNIIKLLTKLTLFHGVNRPAISAGRFPQI